MPGSTRFHSELSVGTASAVSQVNVKQLNGNTINLGAGAVGTGTARVTLASDDPLVAKSPSLGAVSSATVSSLASAASSAQLLASNTSRKGLILYNSDANTVYVKYGTTAAATDFTVPIAPNGYWEMPLPIYTGRIDAIWAADGSGSLFYTEL